MKFMRSYRDRQLLTVKQFAVANPAFSEGSLRWLIFNAETNGFSRAIVRIGRRVLLDPEAFWQAVEDVHQHSNTQGTTGSALVGTAGRKATPPLQQRVQRKPLVR